MDTELLAEKRDMEPLGENWYQKFLYRYPYIKSKFTSNRDRSRWLSQTLEIINYWFELYARLKR
jgi:hypothetical protein